jgi:hypothetical protein
MGIRMQDLASPDFSDVIVRKSKLTREAAYGMLSKIWKFRTVYA